MQHARVEERVASRRAPLFAVPRISAALLAFTLLATAVAFLGSPSAALAATPQPLPLQMAQTLGAQQMVIATGSRLGSTTGTLRVFNLVDGSWVETLSVPARFGKKGLIDGARRKEGSKTTPTGIWRMPNWVFGTGSSAPIGTAMGYRRITSRSWWSRKPGRTYNTWVEARSWPGERLATARSAYEFAVSTGYNQRPNRCVYGRGTAIFLHVRGSGLTAGCIAISRADMIRVCRLLDPASRPVFAVGTLQRGRSTSIWAY